jgi:hypothetical protein
VNVQSLEENTTTKVLTLVMLILKEIILTLVSENIDISYECCVMGLEELANHGIQNPS